MDIIVYVIVYDDARRLQIHNNIIHLEKTLGISVVKTQTNNGV